MTTEGDIETAALPMAETIARLNDKLRKTGEGGTIMVTQGVLALKGFDRSILAAALANYDEFDVDNDPHGERDFGDFSLFQTAIYFKIDYYDSELKFGSNDPADACNTPSIDLDDRGRSLMASARAYNSALKNISDGWIPSALATRSRLRAVTLRSPRSILPICERSIPAVWASASCETLRALRTSRMAWPKAFRRRSSSAVR